MRRAAEVGRVRLGGDDAEDGDAGEEAAAQTEADGAEDQLRRAAVHETRQQVQVEADAGHEPRGGRHARIAGLRTGGAFLGQPVGDQAGGDAAEEAARFHGAGEGAGHERRAAQLFQDVQLAPVANGRLDGEHDQVTGRDEPQERRTQQVLPRHRHGLVAVGFLLGRRAAGAEVFVETGLARRLAQHQHDAGGESQRHTAFKFPFKLVLPILKNALVFKSISPIPFGPYFKLRLLTAAMISYR